MPWMASTWKAGGSFGSTGTLNRSRPTSDITPQHVALTAPTGFQFTDTKPVSKTYDNRWYAVGMGSENLRLDEFFLLERLGIQPPSQVPVLAAGAGTGITASCRVAVAFRNSKTGEMSSLSGWSNTVSLTNQNRSTSNVQATSSDSGVDQIVLFVEVDGATPREATVRDLGVTTIVENVATLALGSAFTTTFERMPHGNVCEVYHDRLAIAGNALDPDVLYVSALFKPDRWEGLSFRTRNGEPIVALVAAGSSGVLLALTPNRPYVLRGYTEDDMVFEPLPFRIGALGPHAVREIEGMAWVANAESIYVYNGSFHNVLKDRNTEWQTEVKANREIYETGFCAHDPNDTTFTFITSGYSTTPSWLPNPPTDIDPSPATVKTVMWTADYSSVVPSISGEFSQPEWFVDAMARTVESAGLLTVPGARRSDLYFGSCDGTSRIKDPTDDNDDGDSYGKRMWIRTPHYLMSDPGGNIAEGKTLDRAWSYMMSEDKEWTLYIRGGDEYAYLQLLPDNSSYWWKDDVDDSLLTSLGAGNSIITYAKKTVHPHIPNRVSGRGFTFDYTVLNALNVVWSGVGGVHSAGPASRGVVSVEEDPG